eukprot:9471791-Pyramimonas_sp.AAC.2
MPDLMSGTPCPARAQSQSGCLEGVGGPVGGRHCKGCSAALAAQSRCKRRRLVGLRGRRRRRTRRRSIRLNGSVPKKRGLRRSRRRSGKRRMSGDEEEEADKTEQDSA